MIRDGVVTAQSDSFSIKIRGKGGHGARPHEAVDAVVVSGFLITALQTLVSREINPLHPSVVTIGTVRAGSARNVIAEHAELTGSIRTSRAEVRQHIHNGMKRMVSAAAELHNATIDIDISEGYPPVVNEPVSTDIAREAGAAIVGSNCVVTSEYPSMGSEDFSYYLAKVPGCFVRLGARHPDWEPVPLHSPGFDVDERVLGIGTRFFDHVARLGHSRMEELANGV
jgi:hippurate hydrolase